MNDDKEMIISLFKSGCSIEGITDTIYSRLKDRENTKKSSERIKINRKDAKRIVEQAIYESYF